MFPYIRQLLFAISSPIPSMAIRRYTPSTSSDRYLLVYRISRYTHISCHSDTCKFRFDPDCIQLSREHVIRCCDSIAASIAPVALQFNNWFSIRLKVTLDVLHHTRWIVRTQSLSAPIANIDTRAPLAETDALWLLSVASWHPCCGRYQSLLH